MGNLNSTSAIIDKTQANGKHSPNRLINKCDQQTQDPTKQELYRLLHFEMDKKPTEIAEKPSNDDLSSTVTSSIVQDVNGTDQNLPVPDKIINMLESGEFSQRESAPTVYAPKKKFLKDYQSNVESDDVPSTVKNSTVGTAETNTTPTPSIRNFSSGFDEIIQASLSGTKAPEESKVAPTHKALNISSCIEAIVESELKKYEQTQDPSTEFQDSNFYLTGSTKQRSVVDPASETMSIRSYLIQNASANSSGAKSGGSGMNRDAVAVPSSSSVAMSRQTGRSYDDRTDRNQRSPATNAAPNHQMYRTFVDEKYHSPNMDTRIIADDYPRNAAKRIPTSNWQNVPMTMVSSSNIQAILTAQHPTSSMVGFHGDSRRKVEGQQDLLKQHSRMDPGQGRMDPGQGRMDPGQGRMDPGQGRIDPSQSRFDPGQGRIDQGQGRIDQGRLAYSPQYMASDQRAVAYQRNVIEPPRQSEIGRVPHYASTKQSYDQSDSLRRTDSSHPKMVQYSHHSPHIVDSGLLAPVEPNVQPLLTGLSPVASYQSQVRDWNNYASRMDRSLQEVIMDKPNVATMSRSERAYELEADRQKLAMLVHREAIMEDVRANLRSDVRIISDSNLARQRIVPRDNALFNKSREVGGPERRTEEIPMDLSVKKSEGISIYDRTLAVNPFAEMSDLHDPRKLLDYQQNVYSEQSPSNIKRPGMLSATSRIAVHDIPQRDPAENMYQSQADKFLKPRDLEENLGMRMRSGSYDNFSREQLAWSRSSGEESDKHHHYSSNAEMWAEPTIPHFSMAQTTAYGNYPQRSYASSMHDPSAISPRPLPDLTKVMKGFPVREPKKATSPPLPHLSPIQPIPPIMSRRISNTNLLGAYQQNDILSIKCKVCGSTYGSLRSFRMHFAKVHGLEPLPEHFQINTISDTKKARSRGYADDGEPPALIKETDRANDMKTNPAETSFPAEQHLASKKINTVDMPPPQKQVAEVYPILASIPSTTSQTKSTEPIYRKPSMDVGYSKGEDRISKPQMSESSLITGQFPTIAWEVGCHKHSVNCESDSNCVTCMEGFQDLTDWKMHVSSMHMMRSCGCMACDKWYANAEELKKHLQLMHRDVGRRVEVEYRCLYCRKAFNDEEVFYVHTQDHEKMLSILRKNENVRSRGYNNTFLRERNHIQMAIPDTTCPEDHKQPSDSSENSQAISPKSDISQEGEKSLSSSSQHLDNSAEESKQKIGENESGGDIPVRSKHSEEQAERGQRPSSRKSSLLKRFQSDEGQQRGTDEKTSEDSRSRDSAAMIKSSSEGSIPEFKITSSPSFSSEPPGVYVQPRFYSSPAAQQADVKFSVDGEEMARSASDRNSRDYRPPSTSSRSSPRDRQIRSPSTSHLPSDSRTAIQSLEQRGYSASKSVRESADVSWPPPPLLKDIISDANPGSSFKRYIDSSCPPGSSFVRENPRSRCVRDICDEIIAQSFREDSSESGKKLKVFDSASFESSMRFSAKQSADASPSVGNSVISFDSLPVKTERGAGSIDVPTADSTERVHTHMGARVSPRPAERSSEDGSSSDSDNIALPSDESTRVSRSKSIVDFREMEIRCNSTDNVNIPISNESPGFPARSGSASSAVMTTDDVVVNERVKTEQTSSESVRLSPSMTASKRRHCDSSDVKPGDGRANVSKENQPDDYEPSAKMPSLN